MRGDICEVVGSDRFDAIEEAQPGDTILSADVDVVDGKITLGETDSFVFTE